MSFRCEICGEPAETYNEYGQVFSQHENLNLDSYHAPLHPEEVGNVDVEAEQERFQRELKARQQRPYIEREMARRREHPFKQLSDAEKLNLALKDIVELKQRVYELEIKLSGEPRRLM